MVGVLSSWRDNIKPRMHPTEDGIITWKEYDKGKPSETLEPAWEPELHLAFQRAEPCIQTRGICLGGAGERHGRWSTQGSQLVSWSLMVKSMGLRATETWVWTNQFLGKWLSLFNISRLTYEGWIICLSQVDSRKERDACAVPGESPRVYAIFVITLTTRAIQLVWGRGWRRRLERQGGWMRKGPGLGGEECGCYLKGNG